MKYLIILAISVLFFANTAVAQEQNIITKTFAETVKIQKKLNMEVTRTLRKIKNDKSHGALFWGVIFAFFYGIIHALGPGHSKAIVASYFISTKEKLKKVPIMAFQISMTHVITPILLVLAADISLRQIITDPESQIYWFKFISYTLIFIIGAYILFKKIRNTNNGQDCSKDSTTLAVSAGLCPVSAHY